MALSVQAQPSRPPATSPELTAKSRAPGDPADPRRPLDQAQAPAPPSRTDDFDRLIRQYQQYALGRAGRERPGGELNVARSLRPDGSWADVDYQDKTRGGWRAYRHLSRVLAMVKTYKSPLATPQIKAQLKPVIHKALDYWLQHDFQNPNWWYNVIGVPQAIGDIAILMQGELAPEELEVMGNRILPRAQIGMTGQNRVWVAGITLVRGLVLRDRSLVSAAASVLGEEIRITTREGIQPDFSFHQHGPQQQFGNYGLSFARDAAAWTLVFRGTPFAFSPQRIDILHDYLTRGESWVVWRDRMDLSSCGRQLDAGCQQAKSRGLARAMEVMSQADPERAADYLPYIQRNADGGANDLVGNKYFWRSDYMIQRATNYYASVKMSSKRVIGAEVVNSENVSGLHLGDGALYLYLTGREYEDIQPVWDWQKLPGTTCAQPPNWPVKFGHAQVKRDFVGGVSDGQSGGAALDYARDGVTARKAWFFLEGAIACLGAGITSSSAEPVVTTVNQCWLRGDVIVSGKEGPRRLERGAHNLKHLDWVRHDGVGYLFPGGRDLRVRWGEQRGNWRKVDDKSIVSTSEASGEVLLLTFEHGTRPQGQTYAYVMVPGAKPEALSDWAHAPAVQLLRNTPALQAVASADGKQVQAVFYRAGELDYAPGGTVAVDRACLLLVDARGATSRLTVADPTQVLETLQVTINGTPHAVKLPRGGQAGGSVAVD